MKKRFRIFSVLCVLLLFITALPTDAETQEENPPELAAANAVIFNAADNGEILYGKGENQPIYCGFLSRVMTCLLIVESDRNLDETVTITKEILTNTPLRSSANLAVGDEISYRDLIRCITVVNSQEAAVAAALTLGGSLSEFTERMNARAAELNASDTVFTNVTGSYTANTRQITTLSDCAKILSEALKHEEILTPATERYTTVTVNGKARTLYTKNLLIEPQSSYYNSAAKGLFIYSESGSNSSIATCRKDADRLLISMAVTTEGLASLYQDAGTLLKYSKNRYANRILLEKGKAVTEVKVKYGKGSDFVVLLSAETVSAYLPKIYTEKDVELIPQIPDELTAPVDKGTVIGTVTVRCAGKEYGTIDLLAQSTVSLDNFELHSAKVMKVFSNLYLWLIVGGLFVLVCGYIFLTYYINRPHRKKTPARDTGGRIRVKDEPEDEEP